MNSLTPRQKQIVEALSFGASISAAADTLNISPKTVKSHLSTIFLKTGTKTRIELVVKYWKNKQFTASELMGKEL